MANFKKNTRYTNGYLSKTAEGNDFLVLRPPLNLTEGEGDVTVTITQDLINRPDLISQKAYGTPDLWWVIYEFNKITDSIFGLTTGQIIKIPEINKVLTAIKNMNKV